MKQVDKLRLAADTVVQQSLEGLDSVLQLGSMLQKREKQQRQEQRAETRAKSRPARAVELEQGMLEASTLGGRMRREVEAFVAAYAGPGMAPNGRAFAERLVEALLHGQPGSSGDEVDLAAAAKIYEGFVDAFRAHDWKEPRLRAGRRVLLRAATLT